MKHIPTWVAITEIVIVGFVLFSLLSILVYAPFWMLGGLSKKRRRPTERSMRLWPLIAVVSLISVVILFMLASQGSISRLGTLTGWSFSVFMATIVFAVASAVSLWCAFTQQAGVRRTVRVYSTLVSVALAITTVYLAYWGIIGLRTWR